MRRTKAEALATRQAILESAERVFFERGVSGTSLEEIAKAAGVTRGAIYWHFRNKGELFEAIHDQLRLPLHEALLRIVEAGSDDALGQLEAFCVDSLRRLHEDERYRCLFSVVLLKCEASGEMESLLTRLREAKSETMDELVVLFGRLQREGRIAGKAEPRILALSLYAYLTGLFVDYLRSPASYRMPEDAAPLVACFFDALRPASRAS